MGPQECRQRPGETLHEYIRRFLKEGNTLPNVCDANVIGALLTGTTYESLVHKLRRKSQRTTKELLDIATNHASSEEAVRQSSTVPRAR
jgi:ribose 5-phosphate isomerase